MTTVADILKAYGPLGVDLLKQALQTVSATGKTVNSVRFEYKKEGTVDRLTFYAREFTKALETGIGPTTKGPSREMIESLTEYARARGMDKPESAAWAVAKVIQKEGDRTKKRGGRVVYSDVVNQLITDMKKELSKNFRLNFTQAIKGSFLALLIVLSSCGSVQTINGVRIPKSNDKPNYKNYIFVAGVSFGFGYYLGKNVINGSNGN